MLDKKTIEYIDKLFNAKNVDNAFKLRLANDFIKLLSKRSDIPPQLVSKIKENFDHTQNLQIASLKKYAKDFVRLQLITESINQIDEDFNPLTFYTKTFILDTLVIFHLIPKVYHNLFLDYFSSVITQELFKDRKFFETDEVLSQLKLSDELFLYIKQKFKQSFVEGLKTIQSQQLADILKSSLLINYINAKQKNINSFVNLYLEYEASVYQRIDAVKNFLAPYSEALSKSEIIESTELINNMLKNYKDEILALKDINLTEVKKTNANLNFWNNMHDWSIALDHQFLRINFFRSMLSLIALATIIWTMYKLSLQLELSDMSFALLTVLSVGLMSYFQKKLFGDVVISFSPKINAFDELLIVSQSMLTVINQFEHIAAALKKQLRKGNVKTTEMESTPLVAKASLFYFEESSPLTIRNKKKPIIKKGKEEIEENLDTNDLHLVPSNTKYWQQDNVIYIFHNPYQKGKDTFILKDEKLQEKEQRYLHEDITKLLDKQENKNKKLTLVYIKYRHDDDSYYIYYNREIKSDVEEQHVVNGVSEWLNETGNGYREINFIQVRFWKEDDIIYVFSGLNQKIRDEKNKEEKKLHKANLREFLGFFTWLKIEDKKIILDYEIWGKNASPNTFSAHNKYSKELIKLKQKDPFLYKTLKSVEQWAYQCPPFHATGLKWLSEGTGEGKPVINGVTYSYEVKVAGILDRLGQRECTDQESNKLYGKLFIGDRLLPHLG